MLNKRADSLFPLKRSDFDEIRKVIKVCSKHIDAHLCHLDALGDPFGVDITVTADNLNSLHEHLEAAFSAVDRHIKEMVKHKK